MDAELLPAAEHGATEKKEVTDAELVAHLRGVLASADPDTATIKYLRRYSLIAVPP